MKRVFKIVAAVLATLCAFSVTGACDNKPSGDVTPDSKKYKATEEELLAEYEATPYKEPVRGIFITPRINVNASQEKFDEEYAKVKAAGINMVATYQEANTKKLLEKTLTASYPLFFLFSLFFYHKSKNLDILYIHLFLL